jgi:adenosylcobinamide-phosphate synthase
MIAAVVTLLALLIERIFGYPAGLERRIGHPAAWMGQLIDRLDAQFNRDEAGSASRKATGVAAIVILVCIVGAVSHFIERGLLLLPFGAVGVAILASSLIAQRSLFEHVEHVASALEAGGLEAGREAVAHIVGRDTANLDEAGVARAAIESLAENFSDAVVAPALYMLIGGLPGAAIYKAINTADSMVGHRTPRHEAFGWASARLDDLVNLPASRLSAFLIFAAARFTSSAAAGSAFGAMLRDAPRHRSPNAGYPEAAMAGALGLALAGPRHYDSKLVDDVWMGEGRYAANAADIRAALALYTRADNVLIGTVALVAALIAII